jgi:lsr operon transcriptional repressor
MDLPVPTFPEVEAADPELSTMLRAAWLYFIEEHTQSEIAEAVGLSRFRVNRMLAECRARGLVRIEFTTPLASCVELEQEAIARFGLSDAVVVPRPIKPERVYAMLGSGAARYMSRCIADPALKVFGVGWGQTMREMLRHLSPTSRPDAQIVTLLGGLPQSSEENSIEIIGKLGRLMGADRTYMTAPIYADTPEARYVIAGQQFFVSVLDLLRRADVACFAVGDMSPSSLLIRHALPKGISAAELKAAGAVGEILGTFINEEGAAIDHRVNRQLLGPGLDDLRAMKSLVLASGGPGKVEVMTGAMHSGLIDVLITDEQTMTEILKRTG